MMNRRGQTGTELMLVISAVLLFMVIVAAASVERNRIALELGQANRETRLCGNISSTVAKFQASQGYSEATVIPNLTVHFEKRNIIVGSNSCYYAGTIKLETAEEVYTEGSEGFDLEQGTQYEIQYNGVEVVFCDASETWC